MSREDDINKIKQFVREIDPSVNLDAFKEVRIDKYIAFLKNSNGKLLLPIDADLFSDKKYDEIKETLRIAVDYLNKFTMIFANHRE